MLGGRRREIGVREYIFSVVCMAALGGIVMMVAPEGVRTGLKKHVKLICSLCLLCVMIDPVSQIIGSMKDLEIKPPDGMDGEDELQSIYESIYEGKVESELSNGVGELVKEKLFEKFSIAKESCRVEVAFKDNDGDGMREPSKITVILHGTSIFKDPRVIEEYISGLVGCECICAIE